MDKNIQDTLNIESSLTIKIATDGSAIGNPGPGGWAWVRLDGTAYGEGKADGKTTNNIMELWAVRAALRAHRGKDLEILTDSKYVIQSVTQWVHGWRKKGWKTAAGTPVANRELIEEIVDICETQRVQFTWVKGHSGHQANERADELARRAASR